MYHDQLITKNRKKSIILITFLMMIIFVETGLHLILYISDTNLDIDWSLRNYFKSVEYGRAYLKELNEVFNNYEYTPFLEWQSKEHKGEYINIDSKGRRRTWNHKPANLRSPKTIYIFGGSTVWGECARDDYTIPSCLSKTLNTKSTNSYIVINYGESAYVFKQEIIRLLILLREGHRPDYVIFYDGSNEVYSAYQSGLPGTILNEAKIHQKLSASSLKSIVNIVTEVFKRRCLIYRGMSKLYNMIPPRSNRNILSSEEEDSIRKLSIGIVEDYLNSMQLLKQLAMVYNFKYICFWQPVIFTETAVNPDDGYGEPRLKDKALYKLYQCTNTLLKQKVIPNFYNFSDVLDGRTTRVYVDFVHLTEGGNEVVAQRMGQLFLKEMEPKTTAPQ